MAAGGLAASEVSQLSVVKDGPHLLPLYKVTIGSDEEATVTLRLDEPATASKSKVAFSRIRLVTSDNKFVTSDNKFVTSDNQLALFSSITIEGIEGRGQVAKTKVGDTGDTEATSVTPIPFHRAVRVDFTASATTNGQVILRLTDRYGKIGVIKVILDDGWDP